MQSRCWPSYQEHRQNTFEAFDLERTTILVSLDPSSDFGTTNMLGRPQMLLAYLAQSRSGSNRSLPHRQIPSTRRRYGNISYCFIYFVIRHVTYTYKSTQYKNKSYSDNKEHHGPAALTDAQHEIKWVKNYSETIKIISPCHIKEE